MMLEIVLTCVVCLAATSPLLVGMGGSQRRVRAIALGVVAITIAAVWLLRPDSGPALERIARTEEVLSDGYVSSATCRKCHPAEYDSWHQSYHRSMTQRASEETVLGNFDDVTLAWRGISYRLHRRGEDFWVEWKDVPGAELAQVEQAIAELERRIEAADTTQTDRAELGRKLAQQTAERSKLKGQLVAYEGRILQITGSHHQQVYWMPGGRKGELYTLPFAWIIADGRWAPRESVFIRPPGQFHFNPWNNNCIKCHTTHGRPQPDWKTASVQSVVAELGIACESCHGPGAEHVAANHSPLARLKRYAKEGGDDTIVQPERLSHDRATQICGYCHSVSSFHDPERYWLEGSHYRPGDDVHAVKAINWPRVGEHVDKSDIPSENSFWSDGVVRLLGREYNGLLDTPCYQRGEMSCMSCHTSHGDDPNDQLAPGMDGDAACVQCHDIGSDISAHTHHPAESTGSRCMNCHMSFTAYGLLKIARSHYVESPRAKTTAETGRPNACTQCHLDKSLGWAAEQLSTWYGHEPVELSDDQQNISATVIDLLAGDAGQRAVAAWTIAWDDARAVSGDDWQAPLVAALLDDAYDAVRYAAYKSLIELPGFEGFDYDFVGPEADRAKASERALEQWPRPARGHAALLLDARGHLQRNEVYRLRLRRDNKPTTLAE